MTNRYFQCFILIFVIFFAEVALSVEIELRSCDVNFENYCYPMGGRYQSGSGCLPILDTFGGNSSCVGTHSESFLNGLGDTNNKFTIVNGKVFHSSGGIYCSDKTSSFNISPFLWGLVQVLFENDNPVYMFFSHQRIVQMWIEHENGTSYPAVLIYDEIQDKYQQYYKGKLHSIKKNQEYYYKTFQDTFVLETDDSGKQRIHDKNKECTRNFNAIRNCVFDSSNHSTVYFICTNNDKSHVYKYDSIINEYQCIYTSEQITKIQYHQNNQFLSIIEIIGQQECLKIIHLDGALYKTNIEYFYIEGPWFSSDNSHYCFVAKDADSYYLVVDGKALPLQNKKIINIYEVRFNSCEQAFGYVCDVLDSKSQIESYFVMGNTIVQAGKDIVWFNNPDGSFGYLMDINGMMNYRSDMKSELRELKQYKECFLTDKGHNFAFIGNMEPDSNDNNMYIYVNDGKKYGPYAMAYNLYINSANNCFGVVKAGTKYQIFYNGELFYEFAEFLPVVKVIDQQLPCLNSYVSIAGKWYQISVRLEQSL